MLALEFFTWWYGQGWAQLAKNMQKRLQRTSHTFSVPILLRTLFAPWRRIVTNPGSSLDAHFRAAVDNAVSRVIGFSVRLIVLFTAGLALLAVCVIAVIELVGWPLLPLAIIFSLIKGLVS